MASKVLSTHIQAPPVRLLLLICCIATLTAAWISLLYPSSDREFALAVVTSVTVTLLVLLFIVGRPSFTDATFIFMCFALIYQVVIPWLYVTATMSVGKEGHFFINNWALMVRGNVIFIIGMAAYAVGMSLCPSVRPTMRATKKTSLELRDRSSMISVLLVIGLAAWAIMFLRSGTPWEVMLGQPPAGRSRLSSLTEGGFGYVMDLTFAPCIAILVYVIDHRTASLVSPKMLLLLYCALVCSGFFGSRLLLVATPIAVLVLRRLLAERSESIARISHLQVARHLKKVGIAQVLVVLLVILPVAILYTEYRVRDEDVDRSSLSRADVMKFDTVNMFDTALTYYMTLEHVPRDVGYWYGGSILNPIILRVPSLLLPDKYDLLYGPRRFTALFYSYDLDEDGTVARGPDMMAEAYINGGVYAIVILMGMLGIGNEYLSRKVRSASATNLLTVAYVIYVIYFMPFAWKAGLTAAISFADVKLLTLLGSAFLVVQGRTLRARAEGGRLLIGHDGQSGGRLAH